MVALGFANVDDQGWCRIKLVEDQGGCRFKLVDDQEGGRTKLVLIPCLNIQFKIGVLFVW